MAIEHDPNAADADEVGLVLNAAGLPPVAGSRPKVHEGIRVTQHYYGVFVSVDLESPEDTASIASEAHVALENAGYAPSTVESGAFAVGKGTA
jgi:hypothetical protein